MKMEGYEERKETKTKQTIENIESKQGLVVTVSCASIHHATAEQFKRKDGRIAASGFAQCMSHFLDTDTEKLQGGIAPMCMNTYC